MSPSVDYADPEPPPPTIETVAAPRPSGPVDSPWERLEAQRTEIETVKPPDELLRPAGPPGIICPACRTENEASRRFCQSCGTPLVVTAPVHAVTARPTPRSMRWVAILIPIVVVAGLIGFAGAAIIKGLPAASATPGATPSAPATTGSAVSSSGSSGPTASSVGPVAVRLRIWQVAYSREVPKDPTAHHSGGKSVDGNLQTSFQQDCAGRRPYVLFRFFGGNVPTVPAGAKPQRGDGKVELATITIVPGDQSSQAAWMSVERPRHLEIWIDGKKALTATLTDEFGSQVITVGKHINDTIQLVIADTYSDGATSTMCGITELSFLGHTTSP
jgi:hypothetical protein